MIPAMRQEKILNILSNDEIVSVEDLMDVLNISISTIRRDLSKLEKESKIVLLHGGGVKLAQKPTELSITTKLDLNRDAKYLIAKKAVSLIQDGDVIFVDPSSTTYHMIPLLTDKNITVITNSISHINQLIHYGVPSIMVGGNIKSTTNSCIGPIAESTLKDLNFNKCFLGANGFTIQAGITNHDINEKVIKTLALQNSATPYFLIDSSKYGCITMVKIADLDTYPIITEAVSEELKDYKNIILAY